MKRSLILGMLLLIGLTVIMFWFKEDHGLVLYIKNESIEKEQLLIRVNLNDSLLIDESFHQNLVTNNFGDRYGFTFDKGTTCLIEVLVPELDLSLRKDIFIDGLKYVLLSVTSNGELSLDIYDESDIKNRSIPGLD